MRLQCLSVIFDYPCWLLGLRIELAFQEQRRAYTTLIRLARSLHRKKLAL